MVGGPMAEADGTPLNQNRPQTSSHAWPILGCVKASWNGPRVARGSTSAQESLGSQAAHSAFYDHVPCVGSDRAARRPRGAYPDRRGFRAGSRWWHRCPTMPRGLARSRRCWRRRPRPCATAPRALRGARCSNRARGRSASPRARALSWWRTSTGGRRRSGAPFGRRVDRVWSAVRARPSAPRTLGEMQRHAQQRAAAPRPSTPALQLFTDLGSSGRRSVRRAPQGQQPASGFSCSTGARSARVTDFRGRRGVDQGDRRRHCTWAPAPSGSPEQRLRKLGVRRSQLATRLTALGASGGEVNLSDSARSCRSGRPVNGLRQGGLRLHETAAREWDTPPGLIEHRFVPVRRSPLCRRHPREWQLRSRRRFRRWPPGHRRSST